MLREATIMPQRATSAADPQRSAAGAWWSGAVGYQVYLRSFFDSDGDGIGDLDGVRRHLDHLADLGVDYLWLTPFYPSPQADHGYDVADHLDVDPVYGSLADLTRLTDEAHTLGLRVVIDIVPNHTSDQHPWFEDARTGRGAVYRDHYVWRDPAADGGPPNNWVSKFGGPAWSLDAASGQYYMHTFLPEQPDLNWANPAVRDAFDDILDFWIAQGVDGFRIDTAQLLTEDPRFRDNPQRWSVPPDADPDTVYFSYDHRYDLDQPDVLDVYRRWRQRTRDAGILLLGEVGLFEAEPVARYVRDRALDLAFYFPTLKTSWHADQIRATLREATELAGDRFAWPLSSHDDPRATQRFGGGSPGAERALAYLTLLVGLPGSPVLLQGDELGLDAGQLPTSARRDPVAARNPGAAGRDASRTPIPWTPNVAGFGFTSGTPWLPFPTTTRAEDTVEVQRSTPGSVLDRTRRLLHVRRQLPDLTGSAPIQWLDDVDETVIAYRRGDTLVALNTSAEPRPVPETGRSSVCYLSATGDASGIDAGMIAPDSAIIARLDPTRASRAAG